MPVPISESGVGIRLPPVWRQWLCSAPGSVGVADSIVPFLENHDTILMENHGALTVGVDIIQAYYRMETLEHFAKVSLVARQLGGAKDLPMDKIQECCEIGKSFPIRHPGYRKYH